MAAPRAGCIACGLDDPVSLVGDEALLLAQAAPTWIGADRAASARRPRSAGAGFLLMDDGLQNPTLVKTASLLVIDGRTGFGNGRVLPAGPLREPVAAAAARCQAAVLIGPDAVGAMAHLPRDLPVLRADLVQDASIAALAGRQRRGVRRDRPAGEILRSAAAGRGDVAGRGAAVSGPSRLYGAVNWRVCCARPASGMRSW